MPIKERLNSAPVLGQALRAYQRYGDHLGNQLAAAVTFYGFLALFPLLTLAAAVTAAVLDREQVDKLKDKIADQLPGLADKIDLDALVRNAGTVGLIGGVLLLVAGLGWVECMRTSIRTLWDLEREPGKLVQRKAYDVGVLLGVGLVLAVSVAGSALAVVIVGRLSDTLNLSDNPVGRAFIQVAAIAIALAVGVVMFLYLLVGMPRLKVRRGIAIKGALLCAVGFEILKVLLTGYIAGVAGKSVYGAFGVPIALLLWIYFIVRLLLFAAAWTAQATAEADAAEHEAAEHEAAERDGAEHEGGGRAGGGRVSGDRGGDDPPATANGTGNGNGNGGTGTWQAGGHPARDTGRAGRAATARSYALGVAGVAVVGVVLENLTRVSPRRR